MMFQLMQKLPSWDELQNLLPYLTPQEAERAGQLFRELSSTEIRPKPSRTFTEWLYEIEPAGSWHWRHLEAMRVGIEKVLAGEIRALINFAPPRHGKSYQGTERLPAYIFEEDPTFQIIQGSYGATLAKTFSRRTRNIVRARIPLSKSAAAIADWETDQGGGLRSAGIGNGVTGRGGHGLIIDDPIKSRLEANSPTFRDRLWEAFTNDFMTRLQPGGCGKFATGWIIMTLTRWHYDDLAGRFLRSDIGRKWAAEGKLLVIHLPAIADPDIVWPDPLGREPGEALCPDRYTAQQLEDIRLTMGNRDFTSLYQGAPTPAEGNLVLRKWIRRWNRRPQQSEVIGMVQSWDTAQKAGELNDWTVCTTWEITRLGAYLVDEYRERLEYPALERAFDVQADIHNPSLIIVEDKGHGTALIQAKRGLYPILAADPETDKMTRLSTESVAYETGRIYHPDPDIASWVTPFETELTSAPDIDNDDRCDSVSQFLAWFNRSLKNFRFKSYSIPSENTEVPGATETIDTSTGYGRIKSGLDTSGF